MAKPKNSSALDALKKFDLAEYRKQLKKHSPALYADFIKLDHKNQMSAMCYTITHRTDMINTLAYKKATKWLEENNAKGGNYSGV